MQPHERIGIGFKGRMGMGRAEAPRSLRSIAMVHSGDQKLDNNSGKRISTIAGLKAALFSVSYATFGVLVCATAARAQTAGATQPQAGSQLPSIQITAPDAKRRANSAPTQRADRAAQRSRSQAARKPKPTSAPKAFAVSQDARTGTVGYYANNTSVATKTNTPLLNVPQSVAVLTKDFIQDQ